MHKIAKEIMDRIKTKINSSGVDGINENELVEMKYWACIADAMTSYDYHFKIIEEMEKPENQYGVNYDENGRFYTPRRDSKGRFTRSYEHDPSMAYSRDMDMSKGRMYYTDANNMSNSSMGYSNGSRMYSESRYDRAKRGYEESKASDPTSDNTAAMTKLFDTLEEDINELKAKMSPSEKSLAKNKLSNMAHLI